MKQVRPADGTVVAVVGEKVNLLVRLALLLLLLRSPLALIPLFWQRGSKMMVLGRLAVRSRRPL